MSEQLSLLDERDTSGAPSSIWSQLPAEVQGELTERLAELLIRVVRPCRSQEEPRDDVL
jgi:hypothetical protein